MPNISYITGFLQTDGSHSGDPERKGRITIELAVRDEAHLKSVATALPWRTSLSRRTRQTNFAAGGYTSAILNLHAQDARRFFAAVGVTPGRKSATVGPPDAPYVASDYVRGLIDGDGSIGFTAKGYPFVSMVTASERLAKYFCDVIAEVCLVRRTARRNTRDNVYNIMVTSTAAQALAAWCYYDGALALPRKAIAASEIAAWTAPTYRFGVSKRRWTPDQDAIVRSHSSVDAAQILDRTQQSVDMRRWRLGVGARDDRAVSRSQSAVADSCRSTSEPEAPYASRPPSDRPILMPTAHARAGILSVRPPRVPAPLAQLVRAGDS